MHVFQEIKQLNGNSKGIFFLFFFRLSAFFTKNKFLKIIGLPIRVLYRIIIQWILGIDVFDVTRIGNALNVYHGIGLIVNGDVVIGNNVTLRHNTTIGNTKKGGKSPVIGNNVEVGANCVIIGDITIGDNAIIAAGSVVIKDVPEYTIVAGNPARVVKQIAKGIEL